MAGIRTRAAGVINSAVFILFALSFTHPRTRRDWRAFGAFSTFLVALFTAWLPRFDGAHSQAPNSPAQGASI